MKIQKITPGFVVQTYDTKTGRCVEQSFVAGENTPMKTKTAIRSIGRKRKTLPAVRHGAARCGEPQIPKSLPHGS